MAKSLLRSVADQITGNGNKTTDIQIVQAIGRFQYEHTKLGRFKREIDKYTQARVLFDNATTRFFEFLCSLNEAPAWSQQQTLAQCCETIKATRNEYSLQLTKEMTTKINSVSQTFKTMQGRIDEQDNVQSDYDKKRRHYQSSLKHDDQYKIDRLLVEVEQLRSTLKSVNSDLREDLPKFQHNVQQHYSELVKEIFRLHGRAHKKLYKSFSNFATNSRDDLSVNTLTNGRDSRLEARPSITEHDTRKLYSIPSLPAKRTDYRVLYRARVITDYQPENDDELALTKDEYISVISFHNEDDNIRDKGWDHAEKSDGTVGLFPTNYIMRLYNNEEEVH